MPDTSYRLATYAAGSEPRAGLVIDERIIDAANALGESAASSSSVLVPRLGDFDR
jgi:hypothetical protein